MKKLIVLATLAALPVAAMADVTISGNLAVGVVNTKTSGTGSVNTEDRTNGEIKFAGSDDLGNGLKAVWQIASRINLADQSDNARDNLWAGRDSYVGLDGAFGRVTAGNIYLLPNSGAMAIFENNSATFASGIYDQGTRYNNTVSYKAPAVAGFSATVQHSFGSSSANEQAKNYADAVSLAYEIGAVSLSYDTLREKVNAAGKKKTLHELNASIGLDALTLQAGYAYAKKQAPTAAEQDYKRSGWGLAASYAMGNVTPKVGFWKESKSKRESGVKNNDGHTAYAVGVDYALSKRTRTGVEFAKVNYNDGAVDKEGKKKLDARTITVYLGTKF